MRGSYQHQVVIHQKLTLTNLAFCHQSTLTHLAFCQRLTLTNLALCQQLALTHFVTTISRMQMTEDHARLPGFVFCFATFVGRSKWNTTFPRFVSCFVNRLFGPLGGGVDRVVGHVCCCHEFVAQWFVMMGALVDVCAWCVCSCQLVMSVCACASGLARLASVWLVALFVSVCRVFRFICSFLPPPFRR